MTDRAAIAAEFEDCWAAGGAVCHLMGGNIARRLARGAGEEA